MAQPAATNRALFQGADPRASAPGSLLQAYSPANAALQSADLLRSSTNTHEALVFLGHSTLMDGPIPLVCPFSLDAPGNPHNTGEVYALAGDLTDNGGHPPLVVVNATVFDRVQNVVVPTNATLNAVWNALPDADHFILPPAANTEQVTVRHVVPVPHPYVAPILQAYADGELSPRWMLVNVFDPIIADNDQAQHYAPFVQWFKASSTAPAAGQRPQLHLDLAGVFGRPRITQALPTVTARYLPGTQAPNNMQANMTLMVQHQQNLAAQLAQVAQPRAKTLMDTNPVLAQNALKVSERTQLSDLTPFWQNLHLVSKTGYSAALQQAISTSDYPPALISPSFVADFIGNRWVAPHGSAISQGIGLTRMPTYASGPDFVERHAQTGTAFNILEVYSTTGPELARMVLTQDAQALPRTTVELTACIKACYGFMEVIWGAHASHVVAFRTQIVDRLDIITGTILRDYYSHEHEVCLKVTIYIFRHSNACISNLINGPIPTAANPQPARQTPPYEAITDQLVGGSIRTLVDLPEGLFRPRPAPVPAPVPAPAPAPTPAPQGSTTPAPAPAPAPAAVGGSRRPITGRPEWNVGLRGSWAATGNRALFTVGSPYHRPNNPPKNRVILKRLAGDRSKTICLKMALTNECMDNCSMCHGPLTPEETQAIAREGGFSL